MAKMTFEINCSLSAFNSYFCLAACVSCGVGILNQDTKWMLQFTYSLSRQKGVGEKNYKGQNRMIAYQSLTES